MTARSCSTSPSACAAASPKPVRAAGQELAQTLSAGTLLVSPEQSQNEALDLADRALDRARTPKPRGERQLTRPPSYKNNP